MEETNLSCPFCGKGLTSKDGHLVCSCGFKTGCFGNFGYFQGCESCSTREECIKTSVHLGTLNLDTYFNPSRRKQIINEEEIKEWVRSFNNVRNYI